MDPGAADPPPPCVIQALPARSPSSDALPPPPLVQALPAHPPPAKDRDQPPVAAATTPTSRPPRRPPPQAQPPSPRRTRSGGAPEWTPAETLALVAEVAAVDDGWSRSVSAFQKWAMVAENLAASEPFASGPARRPARGNKRAARECRRRWEALAAEYGAVRRWEVRTGGSYWELAAAARRKAGLPVEFDPEVFGVMDALIRVEEAQLADAAAGGGGGEEVEGLVGTGGAGIEVGEEDRAVREDEVQDEDEAEEEDEDEAGEDKVPGDEIQAHGVSADASMDLEGCEMVTSSEPEKSHNEAWELANKLQQNAEHIHTILNEEADGAALGGSMSPDAMEATRRKADELIASLGGLVSYLNQFTELVKENGFENIVGMT